MSNVTVTPYFVEGDRYPCLIGVKAEGDEYETAYVSKQELIKMDERHRSETKELRELVADMWFWSYCGHMDSQSQEWQMKHISGVLDRMRELGIEVKG